MIRREFFTLLGGAALSWSLSARTHAEERVRRIAVLMGGAENDAGVRATRAALQEGLAKLGWIEGQNLRTELRFGGGTADRINSSAAELVELAPEVIVTDSGPPTNALQQRTRKIPIIFTAGGDPVVVGRVQNITRPEGNITGFSTLEAPIAGKCLELLKEAVPHLAIVAVVFNTELLSSVLAERYISAVEAAARTLGVQMSSMPARNAQDLVRTIETFAVEPNGGLLVLPPPLTTSVREVIFQLTAQHRLPSIYLNQADAAASGLLAYAADRADLSRRAATYVDRLLRGSTVADLPVQFPTKFTLVINQRVAKNIGIEIPPTFLARADEVIE